MLKKQLPNNEVVLQAVDSWNRVTQIKSAPGANSPYTFDQKYDLTGNVVSVTETYPEAIWNRSKTMTYDRADRLIGEVTSTGGTVQTLSYTYDDAGNRTKLTQNTTP
jgi:YD repeat-containing protein